MAAFLRVWLNKKVQENIWDFQGLRKLQPNNSKIALSKLRKIFLTKKMFSLSTSSGHMFIKRKSGMTATG